jgi:hypothetical protein
VLLCRVMSVARVLHFVDSVSMMLTINRLCSTFRQWTEEPQSAHYNTHNNHITTSGTTTTRQHQGQRREERGGLCMLSVCAFFSFHPHLSLCLGRLFVLLSWSMFSCWQSVSLSSVADRSVAVRLPVHTRHLLVRCPACC